MKALESIVVSAIYAFKLPPPAGESFIGMYLDKAIGGRGRSIFRIPVGMQVAHYKFIPR